MNQITNPYTPGAGSMPDALVGRDNILEDARVLLERTLRKRSARSMIMVGLRGVGKTVLLNRIESMAQQRNFKTIAFEVTEERSLLESLVPEMRRVLLELNRSAGVGEAVRRSLIALRNFIGTVKITCSDFGLELEPMPGLADSGNMAIDLTDLFLLAAAAAAEKGTGIVLLIDEIQLLRPDELSALIMAMHKVQQKQAALLLFGAGLPTLPGLAGEAKSYAERLFVYPAIGQLQRRDAFAALAQPAAQEGVLFEEEALESIYQATQGYPYFLQEWGSHVWGEAEGNTITARDVHAVADDVVRCLDQSFFRVRFDRLTEAEKRFMRAMADLGSEGCRSGAVARYLGVKSTAITTVRASLISKGMLYSPAYGVIEFSVPLFSEFLKRTIPNASGGA